MVLKLCAGVQEPNFAKSEHKNSRAIKGAPLESLFAQFCLHSLWVDSCNIRGMNIWVNKCDKDS